MTAFPRDETFTLGPIPELGGFSYEMPASERAIGNVAFKMLLQSGILTAKEVDWPKLRILDNNVGSGSSSRLICKSIDAGLLQVKDLRIIASEPMIEIPRNEIYGNVGSARMSERLVQVAEENGLSKYIQIKNFGMMVKWLSSILMWTSIDYRPSRFPTRRTSPTCKCCDTYLDGRS